MTVKEIIEKYLRDNGYDGLWCEGCGCPLDDLIPGHECRVEGCRPGYRAFSKEWDEWIVQGEKPEEKEDE